MNDTTTETPAQAEIRELRAQLAAVNAAKAERATKAEAIDTETHPRPTNKLRAGDQIHFVKSGLMFRTSDAAYSTEVSQRAQVVTLTDRLIEASRDSEGRSWLDLADDIDSQIAKWGEQKFARGPAPASMRPWESGTVEEDIARERALAEVWAMPEGEQRDKALAEVRRTYGRSQTSQTIMTMGFEK